MNIKEFIKDWLQASNNYDTKTYLKMWHKDAILDDPSVGRIFKGHPGIQNYFEDYFIGYKTQTRLLKLDVLSDQEAHIKVEFTGEFPEKKIKGIFHLTFKEDKIASAKADLI